MAIALARLLGYELTPNFNFPYFSPQHHRVLAALAHLARTWLRDYLYIPLGGNRGTALFAFRNLMLTMLLGGLWHGAAWNFVIWGGLNGLALTFHRYWETVTADWGATFKKFMGWVAVPITFYVFLVTLVFVRAHNVYHQPTRQSLSSPAPAPPPKPSAPSASSRPPAPAPSPIIASGLFAVIALVHYANYRGWLSTWWQRIPYWLFAAILGIGYALAMVFIPAHYQPFIYFQF